MSAFAGTAITYLKGLGPQRAELLQKELGVFTYADLLRHYPFRYVDRSRYYRIRELNENLPYVQVKGKLKGFAIVGEKQGRRLVGQFSDGSDILELVWFKGIQWISKFLKTETEYVAFGKPNLFNGRFSIVHPEMETPAELEKGTFKGLMPVYPVTEKLKASKIDSKAIAQFQQRIFEQPSFSIPEFLPEKLLEKYKLLRLDESIRNIHFPASPLLQQKAESRLKFEELLMIQLKLLRIKQNRSQNFPGVRFPRVGDFVNSFYKNCLPFELTGAQKRVIKEIHADMQSGKQMNRLLQGDVGSGKTVVALMCMLIALDNGSQSALMAPTEVLATQHYQSIARLTENLGIKVRLLTGSSTKKEREEIHAGLQGGDIHILIGTHALLEDVVQFNNLGFVVIDEQHRFGVAQRARLWSKNSSFYPHVLVMTATPIPRTLAMTLYGDLDTSAIDEMPAGRKPIQTAHRFEHQRRNVYAFMKDQIDAGRQAYIIYPLIEESETLDYRNLMNGYDSVADAFPIPQYHISMVHGRMKAREKELEMQRFKRRETQIMIATTVIEVGIDVPNANIILIESAEKFGLSQLHQLRGRVGRGSEQSYCILMTSVKLGNEAKKRMEALVKSSNGFEIAEYDLKLRGPGDLEGTQQSGVLDLKLADLSKDQDLVALTRKAAMELLADDPELAKQENKRLLEELQKKNQGRFWARIS